MNCPCCNKEMIVGVVQSGREIFFTEKEHNFFLAPGTEDVSLSYSNWTKPTCTAYHCPDCKKVVIDYSDK